MYNILKSSGSLKQEVKCKISRFSYNFIYGKLYDMIKFLNEFGYQTVVNGDTLVISWFPSWENHMSYVDDFDEEEY